MRDSQFIRDRIPMTKQEVRAVVLDRLELDEQAVFYDIGAGTGSVAVEAALKITGGQVYAIEKKAAAVELIKKNCARFGVGNVAVIYAEAVDVLADLPVPTHVFIGGSGGSLDQILDLLRAKGEQIRIVITAITLETLNQAMAYFKRYQLTADIVSVQVARACPAGSYHLMKGENPIYILTFGGRRCEEGK